MMRTAADREEGITGGLFVDRTWQRFETGFRRLTGVFVQAFDARGRPLHAGTTLPPLCGLLDRNPMARAVCSQDCLVKVAAHPTASPSPAGHVCHAGLSFRVFTLPRRGSTPLRFQVGRVFTELFGEEQVTGFTGRFRIDRREYLDTLRMMRHLSAADLGEASLLCCSLAAAFSTSARRSAGRLSRLRRLRRESSRMVSELRFFHDLSNRMLAARSVEEVLSLALEGAMASVEARRGSILLADPAGERVLSRLFRGRHAGLGPLVRTIAPGSVTRRVLEQRRPLLVRDAALELAGRRAMEFPYSGSAFAAVPLRSNGTAIGVLSVTERAGDSSFTEGDLELLEALGIQTASAIRRVRLDEEVRDLRVHAETDPLTGARNRRALEEVLAAESERVWRYGQDLAAVMIDIDDFKRINDELGHAAGDAVLQQVYRVIRDQVRAPDLLARFGGDEFVLLLPGTRLDGALGTAEKIRSRVESTRFPALSDRGAARLTVSCGVAHCSGTDGDPGGLLREADEALLEAKGRGKNAVAVHAPAPR